MENFANGIKHYNTVFCSIGNPFTKEVCGYPSDEVDDSLPLCSRHRKLINEPLREQIAREIEARVIGSVDTKGGFGEAFNQGIVTAAAIARGE
jgi:hypothetical protein